MKKLFVIIVAKVRLFFEISPISSYFLIPYPILRDYCTLSW